jgi:hypothetical protein
VRIRLFLDEDAMAHALVNGLRARGIDVLTVGGVARKRLEDAEQLEFATSQGRVLYTFNTSDFYQLHTEWLTQGKAHSGIAFAAQQRYAIGEQIRRLLRLMRARSAEEMIGKRRISKPLGIVNHHGRFWTKSLIALPPIIILISS